MKKLLILFALFLTIGMASAQQSLTKEETISYIHDIVKSSSGKTNITTSGYSEIRNQSFSENEVSYQRIAFIGMSQNSTSNFKAMNIPWETLDMESANIPKIQPGTQVTAIQIKFKGSFPVDIERIGDLSYKAQKEFKEMVIHVRNDKVENVRKAFLHLQDVCKKVDPFD